MIWLKPWDPVENWADDWKLSMTILEYQRAWESQLKREVGIGHVLYGRDVKLIARRWDTDDALFLLEDGSVADVHLTWAEEPGPNPGWPVAGISPSLDIWADEAMRPLHEEMASFGAWDD